MALTAYGQTTTNYVVDYTTNISSTVVWHPLLNFTITNSFLTTNHRDHQPRHVLPHQEAVVLCRLVVNEAPPVKMKAP